MELILEQVTKQYPGTVAVDRVSADLQPGVIGLLGSNGAGKTTLMRMICGIIKPTSGTICFRYGNDTLNASDEMYRDALGYLPQDFGYYPNFTGREFLMYVAALKGIDKGAAKRKSEELLKIVSLDPKERVRFRNLIAELGKDAIVILSTHIVSDVEHIADRIIMMKDGSIIFDGRGTDIREDLESFYLRSFEEEENE